MHFLVVQHRLDDAILLTNTANKLVPDNEQFYKLLSQLRITRVKMHEVTGFGEEPDRDKAKAMLTRIAPSKSAQFGYGYDFGNSWEHEITVEKVLPPDPKAATVTRCLDDTRACPPEDRGGIWGYANLLEIPKKSKHPGHKDMKAWVDGALDADAFDLARINFWLRKLKGPRVTEAQSRKVLMSRDDYRED